MENQQNIQAEQERIVYSQTVTCVVGNLMIGAGFLSVFWSTADHVILLSWYACMVLLSAARIILYKSFLDNRSKKGGGRSWGRKYAVSAFMLASLWSSAFLIFLPAKDPIYHVIVGMWMVGLSATAVSAYTAHFATMLAYFVPVTVPGTIQFFVMGGRLNTALGIAVCVYSIIVMRALLQINRSMVDAIKLNFDLEREIDVRKKVEEKLREISFRDGLTGLFNRRHFDEVLDRELRRAKRDAHPLSLILLDLDYFKAFNDTYGHLEGDSCLQRVSLAIEKAINRPGDIAVRYGGEELAVVLPDTDNDNACIVAEKIRKNVEALCIEHKGSKVAELGSVTISAGVATANHDFSSTPSEIISQADNALYRAKTNGRNRVEAC